MTLIAVNFHYVRTRFDTPFPGIHGISPEQLEAQLALLSMAGTFVSGADVLAAVQGERPLPPRSLLVTFDDGLREQFEVAWPVLKRMGIPALFFVNTHPIAERKVSTVHKIHLLRANIAPDQFLEKFKEKAGQREIPLSHAADAQLAIAHYKYDTPEVAQLKYLLNVVLPAAQRDLIMADMFDDFYGSNEGSLSESLYMDKAQIAELDRTRSIGSHSHQHLPLGMLSPDEIECDVDLSIRHLREWSGHAPFAFSYPYGTKEVCTRAAADVIGKHGVRFAFTMERAANQNLDQPLHLARFDNNDMPGGKAAVNTIADMFDRSATRDWYLN